jgi:hypothetical protein
MIESHMTLSSLAPMIYVSTAIVLAFVLCQLFGLDPTGRLNELVVRFSARNRVSNPRA